MYHYHLYRATTFQEIPDFDSFVFFCLHFFIQGTLHFREWIRHFKQPGWLLIHFLSLICCLRYKISCCNRFIVKESSWSFSLTFPFSWQKCNLILLWFFGWLERHRKFKRRCSSVPELGNMDFSLAGTCAWTPFHPESETGVRAGLIFGLNDLFQSKWFYDSMVCITITPTGSTLPIFLDLNSSFKLFLVNQSYKFLFLPGLWRLYNCRKLLCPHLLKGKFWANIQCSWMYLLYLSNDIAFALQYLLNLSIIIFEVPSLYFHTLKSDEIMLLLSLHLWPFKC